MRPLRPDDAGLLLPLVRGYAFKPYRHYRTLSPQVQEAVLAREVESLLAEPGGAVALDSGGAARAAVLARRLAWDSEFFGVPMGRIDLVLGDDDGARDAALRSSLEALRHGGVLHVSARIDAGDLAGTALLEHHGFRLVDSLVTYIARPNRPAPGPLRGRGRIRPLDGADAPEVVAIAEEAFRGFRGRFHADPHLPRDRAEALYPEWARQCVSGRMADTVLVSEGGDGRLLGFLAFRQREPVSTVSGVPVFGAGLGACRPDTPGAYVGLIRAGIAWAHARGGVAECQTQNYNHATIRVYEAAGLRFARAEYTLHAWLGGAVEGVP